MKLTIPTAAMPVVRVLRREVPRPRRLPVAIMSSVVEPCLRWVGGFNSGADDACPMGLHPDAHCGSPDSIATFPLGGTNTAVIAFWQWWDVQSDARAAVDAVWPRKARRAKR